MKEGRLFVVSGPSGAGKGTICDELIRLGVGKLSISMTTRAIRGNEVPGVNYYYVTDEEFDKTIKENGFLEYAGVYGHRYGTPKAPVIEALEAGTDVILEIEMQGAQNVKRNFSDAVLIFVLPPSLDVLSKRLIGRNADSAEQIAQRTMATISEIHRINEYDYFVINDKLDDAVNAVCNIIAAEHGNEESIRLAQKNKVDDKAIKMIKMYEEEAGK